MSEYCEVCESVAVATSSCPATDVIVLRVEVANATSSAVVGLQPQGVLTSTAAATGNVFVDAYAVLIGTANAASEVSHTLTVTEMLISSAKASSSVVQMIEQMAESAAHATDEILISDASFLLTSAAHAVSSIESVGTIAEVFLTSKADAKSSFASLGLIESLTSAANATSMFAVLQRRVDVAVDSSAEATSGVDPSVEPQTYLLISTANGTSIIHAQNEVNVFVSASAEGTSDVWFKDPSAKAWVMNTETTAAGWYDNYSFESIVSWKGREIAVGPDGVFELVGDTDDGKNIDSLVESGFSDFGSAQTKRLDNMYFGYTSGGQISVQTEVYESGTPPRTYLLEKRDAAAPRNSRVTPGKGLWGRYWRLTIKNVGGADFEVHDATVDLAMSTRRI